MGRDRAMSAALQLQHYAGLILSNLQILGQFVTSLNRMYSEVMQLAFAHGPFPTEAVQSVASHRVRRAAHYMSAMGLWRPPSTHRVCLHDVLGLLSGLAEVNIFRTCRSEHLPDCRSEQLPK